MLRSPATAFKLGQTVANKRHPQDNHFRAKLEVSPSGPCFPVACSQSARPHPQPGPAWDTRCSGPGQGARPGVASSGQPKPHVPAGRAPEPAPAPPLRRGLSAAGSCQPRSAPRRLPTVPSARPATARILLNPAAPAAPRGLLLVPGPPRTPGPQALGPPPLTARWRQRPGRETPAAGEQEREDERACAQRRRRRRRRWQSGRLSPRPELRLVPPGAGGAFPAEQRRHECGRPLTAARAGGQRARRPKELSWAQPGPSGQAGSAAVPKARPEAEASAPETRSPRPETRPFVPPPTAVWNQPRPWQFSLRPRTRVLTAVSLFHEYA